MTAGTPPEALRRGPQPAPEGAGPLLQRDYWVVIEGGRCTPARILEMIRADFPRFSPRLLAEFRRPPGETRPLETGDAMEVHIRGAGAAGVRITEVDGGSLTMVTLEGHPEAGRISFGAYRDPQGRLVFRIRSRARSGDPLRLAGYALFGMALQTAVWKTFCRRVAKACGGRTPEGVQSRTEHVEQRAEDARPCAPATFPAGEE